MQTVPTMQELSLWHPDRTVARPWRHGTGTISRFSLPGAREMQTLPRKYYLIWKGCRLRKFLIAPINWTDTIASQGETYGLDKVAGGAAHSMSPYWLVLASQ